MPLPAPPLRDVPIVLVNLTESRMTWKKDIQIPQCITMYHILILNPMLLAIVKHLLIPLVSLIPPILDDLHLALAAQSMEDTDVICIADADPMHFTCILQRHQHTPRLEGVFDSFEWGVEDVAVEVCRAEVGERLLERRFDLFCDWIPGVVWERLV